MASVINVSISKIALLSIDDSGDETDSSASSTTDNALAKACALLLAATESEVIVLSAFATTATN